MTHDAARVALATCAAFPLLDEDDVLVLPELERLGITPIPAVWDDSSIDWSEFDLVVLRSTWDYAERRDEFLEWARTVPRMLNAFPIVQWSSDKHYFHDLQNAGIATVPTSFVEPGDDQWSDPGSAQFVVKPAISAGSRDTVRYVAGDQRADHHVRSLLADGRSVMIQPYLERVDTSAETAVLFMGGQYSHSIRKGPLLPLGELGEMREGLFIQEQIDPREPRADQLAVARATYDLARSHTGCDPLYARIDLLDDDQGNPVVLEVEMVEPSLFLRTAPELPARWAAAIAARL